MQLKGPPVLSSSNAPRPRLVVIGTGRMGQMHARVAAESEVFDLVGVADIDPQRARDTADRFNVAAFEPDDIIGRCDAAVIATSTAAHVELSSRLLHAGVPVLCEKPIATDIADVEYVVGVSDASSTPLMCGFLERHNAAANTALQLLDGPPLSVRTIRWSPATHRDMIDIVWDLGIHDLDLIVRACGDVVADGVFAAPGFNGEMVDVHLSSGESSAMMSLSRCAQQRTRRLVIVTAGKELDVDLATGTVTAFEHVSLGSGAHGLRTVTAVEHPYVRSAGEPLAVQLTEFRHLIDGTVDADTMRASLVAPHRLATQISDRITAAAHS
jgi:predicted dehydrogenase